MGDHISGKPRLHAEDGVPGDTGVDDADRSGLIPVGQPLPELFRVAFPFIDRLNGFSGLDKSGEVGEIPHQHLKMPGGDAVAQYDDQRISSFQSCAVMSIFVQAANEAGVVLHNLQKVLRCAGNAVFIFQRIGDEFFCQRCFNSCFHNGHPFCLQWGIRLFYFLSDIHGVLRVGEQLRHFSQQFLTSFESAASTPAGRFLHNMP